MRACMREFLFVCVCVCVCVCVRACMRACVRSCVPACVRVVSTRVNTHYVRFLKVIFLFSALISTESALQMPIIIIIIK